MENTNIFVLVKARWKEKVLNLLWSIKKNINPPLCEIDSQCLLKYYDQKGVKSCIGMTQWIVLEDPWVVFIVETFRYLSFFCTINRRCGKGCDKLLMVIREIILKLNLMLNICINPNHRYISVCEYLELFFLR